jgi:hypothetical protein
VVPLWRSFKHGPHVRHFEEVYKKPQKCGHEALKVFEEKEDEGHCKYM